MPKNPTPKETIWRVTLKRTDGGENYASYREESKAVAGIEKRLNWGAYTGAVLRQCEREVGTWGGERVIATRTFDRSGQEVK